AERLRIEDGLRRLSAYDALTECYNRRAFLAIAEGEFDRFQRHGRALSLMMIDADHIRQINESHGHLAGDDILRHLVHRCGLIMRISDLIGRFGGEEFAILLPETAMAGVERTAERLRADVAREPLKSGGTKVHYTVSIGVAEARAADKTLDDLLRRAESALAMAKISGRNQVRRAA
ncbi:MAG: GGDEF domain-containing protein, partial [Rhodospirillaceae bacterium]